jgi:diaminopimelate epimerase
MRIFNADGSEAEMCGNGSRCAAFWQVMQKKVRKAKLKMETKAGIVESVINGDNVRVRLTEPKDIRLDVLLTVNGRKLKVNFVNTGVPHAIVFVEGLEKIDVHNIGKAIRYHDKFQPQGTNVDFVEIVDDDHIKVRTYERGVEAETLACGTGSTASAIFSSCHSEKMGDRVINVKTRGGEILKVFFNKTDTKISDVWLEGLAKIVYKGVYYV